MNNKTPLVSVVIAAYNEEEFIEDCVNSILQQTFGNFECILIDDASDDKTFSLMETFNDTDSRIKIFRHETNRGFTKTLNHGIKLANCKYIAYLGADDIAYPQRLEKQVEFLENNEDYGLVGSNVKVVHINDSGEIYNERKYNPPISYEEIQSTLFRRCPFIHSSTMIRQTVFDDLGYFNENYQFRQDYEMWGRILQHYYARNLPDVLVEYRKQSGRISTSPDTRLKRKLYEIKIPHDFVTKYGYSWTKYYWVFNNLTEVMKQSWNKLIHERDLKDFLKTFKGLIN